MTACKTSSSSMSFSFVEAEGLEVIVEINGDFVASCDVAKSQPHVTQYYMSSQTNCITDEAINEKARSNEALAGIQ